MSDYACTIHDSCLLGHAYVVPVAVAPVSRVVMKTDTKRSSDPIIRRAHI